MTTTNIDRDRYLLLLEGRLLALNERDLATVSRMVDCLLYADPAVHPADEYGEPLGDTPELRARILNPELLVTRRAHPRERARRVICD